MRLGKLEDAHGLPGSYEAARGIHYTYDCTSWHNRPHHLVWATVQQANDIELLLDYIKLAIAKACKDGYADGRSLIQRLATAGVEDLNRIITGRG